MKKEVRNEKRALQKEEAKEIIKKDEGIVVASTKRKHISVTDCNDVATLEEMMENSHSRGKKQRIRKKI